jgi:chromosome condensin MukBEF ATPase and DNA-binding subunit MukB
MLMALLLAVILSGSSGTSALIAAFDHAKAVIKADITDKAQRTELLSVIDLADKVTKEDLKNKKKSAEELLALAARHDATAGDIEPVLEKLRADNESYQDRMIQYRFALKAKMSREQWAKVYPPGEPDAPQK